MKWLVCRTDAIRSKGEIRTSEYWPTIVEADNPERALEIVFGGPPSTSQRRSWYVVPMRDAVIISVKPRQQYDVVVEPFYADAVTPHNR